MDSHLSSSDRPGPCSLTLVSPSSRIIAGAFERDGVGFELPDAAPFLDELQTVVIAPAYDPSFN